MHLEGRMYAKWRSAESWGRYPDMKKVSIDSDIKRVETTESIKNKVLYEEH